MRDKIFSLIGAVFWGFVFIGMWAVLIDGIINPEQFGGHWRSTVSALFIAIPIPSLLAIYFCEECIDNLRRDGPRRD